MQGLDIVEVVGGVGDEEHVEGLLEVADIQERLPERNVVKYCT